MRHMPLTILLFALASLLGPLLRLAAWPPSRLMKLPDLFDFLYQLIFLLWPAQPFADMEIAAGPAAAGALATGANVVLYAAMGAFVSAFGRRRRGLISVFAGVAVAVVIFAVWTSRGVASLNALALTAALLLYALLFCVIDRLNRTARSA